MKIEFNIENESPNDYYESEAMTKKAFWNLHVPGCSEHFLLHKLRTADCFLPSLSFVAKHDGKVVGGIWYAEGILKCPVENIKVLTFGPLCVDPQFQKLGIGTALLKHSITAAKDMGFGGIIIFGEPEYYPKFGFKTCDCFGITTPEGENFPAFMALELCENGLKGGTFKEPDVYYDITDEEVDKYDENFPYLEKLILPTQWGQGGK